VPKEAVTLDETAVLPASYYVAQGRLGQLALDAWGAWRQPAQKDAEDVGAGRVLLAQPAQGGHVSGGDAQRRCPNGDAATTRRSAGLLPDGPVRGPWTFGPGHARPAR
jgi:hypothetical protein